MENILVREKGSGLSVGEEFDIYKFAEEALKDQNSHLKIIQHIANKMNTNHHGKWTVFIIESLTTPWEAEFYPVEDKKINFTLKSYNFLVYKSNHE